jgi:hypothetical protein
MFFIVLIDLFTTLVIKYDCLVMIYSFIELDWVILSFIIIIQYDFLVNCFDWLVIKCDFVTNSSL